MSAVVAIVHPDRQLVTATEARQAFVRYRAYEHLRDFARTQADQLVEGKRRAAKEREAENYEVAAHLWMRKLHEWLYSQEANNTFRIQFRFRKGDLVKCRTGSGRPRTVVRPIAVYEVTCLTPPTAGNPHETVTIEESELLPYEE